MKIVPFVLVGTALMMCGCATSRYSGRYGDGSVYAGIGNSKTFRKFYVRKIEGDGAVSAASLSKAYPNLFSKVDSKDNIPVDLYIKQGKLETSGEWSFVFACLYSIIPTWFSHEQPYTIDFVVADDERLVPQACCCFAHDFKVSIFSPLGLIPYGDKTGYQRNEFTAGLSTPDIAGVLSDVMGLCVAQQLTKYALDRLTIPDVEFTMADDGEVK